MALTSAQKSQLFKKRMEVKGFVRLQVWVLKKNVVRIKEIEAADKASSKGV